MFADRGDLREERTPRAGTAAGLSLTGGHAGKDASWIGHVPGRRAERDCSGPEYSSTRGELVRLQTYRLDLHIHTVLSPCTEISDMTPKAVVEIALQRGLDMIAICDHNSARNTAATRRAARGTKLVVVPGMEITSSEEVHIVGLFPSDDAALAAQEEVYGRLFGQNDEEVFGYQVVANEFDEVDDLDQRLLIGATTLSADKVTALIHGLHGLALAAHVDRGGFSIFSQLGFIPEGLKLDALEVSKRSDFETVRAKYPQTSDYTLVSSSDAHYREDIGAAYTLARMAEPTFEELSKALAGKDGRAIVGGRVAESRP